MPAAQSIYQPERLCRQVFIALIGAMSLLLWLMPTAASAATGLGRCVDMSAFVITNNQGRAFRDADQQPNKQVQTGEDAPVGLFTPCGASQSEGETDESLDGNLCFEDLQGQIYTHPRLVAERRGVHEAAAVITSILDVMAHDNERPERSEMSSAAELGTDISQADQLGNEGELRGNESAEMSAEPAISLDALRSQPRLPRPSGDELSCTSSQDECEALPPLLRLGDWSTLSAVGPPPFDGAPKSSMDLDFLQSPGWSTLSIGPHAGFSRLPEKPPRHS